MPPPAPRRIIIRTGDLEFEIESFDASVATILKLVNAAKGSFVATINSDKLPNGKVRGAVVVRVCRRSCWTTLFSICARN